MANDRSAWKALGIGCLFLAVLAAAFAVVGGVWFYRSAKRVEREMQDPAARTEKAKRLLGTTELPAGYHAMVAFSIPFLMDVAILSGQAPDEKGVIRDLGERGLIYVQFIRAGQDEQELRDYFDGKTSDPHVLRENNIDIDADEIIRRGVVPLADATLMYVAQRGRVSAEGVEGEGLTSMCLIDCPADKRLRMAIWFVPDPSPDSPVAELDLTGTPADEAALAEFMGRFRFCR